MDDSGPLKGQYVTVRRDPSLRASDAEREEVAAVLRQSLAEGRLSMLEFDERLDAVYRARTYGDLDALLTDLPHRLQPEQQTLPAAATWLVEQAGVRRVRRERRRWSRYVTVNAVCWAIWGVAVATSGGHHFEGLWPLWVTVPWGVVRVRRLAIAGGSHGPRVRAVTRPPESGHL